MAKKRTSTRKKVAYIVTRCGTRELIEGCLLTTIAAGTHGADVVAMHFAEDGVYHLVKGSTNGKKIARAIKDHGVVVLACECSVEHRGLRDKLVGGVAIGHFSHFWEAAADADHVIAL